MVKNTKITWTRVDNQGRVVIPAEIRERAGIEPGASIAFVEEDGELGLMTVQDGIKRAQAIARRHVDKRKSLVDELIAERRAEATRE